MIKYIHTIGGQPGYYDGEQICFAVTTIPIPTCDSLQQIKRERAATVKWRAAQKYGAPVDYGHMRIKVA